MKGSFKVRAPLVATVNAAPFIGSGTISPGLTLAGGANTFTFSGEGAVASDSEEILLSCAWSGNDTIGTFAQGSGDFSGSCADWAGTVTISGSYARTLEVMTVDATASDGGVNGFLLGVCD